MINKENNKYEMFEEPNDGLAINMGETGVIPLWSIRELGSESGSLMSA